MVYDYIENISIYKKISPDIYKGLLFIANATPDIVCGKHQLSSKVIVTISEYSTKAINENGYESHYKNIDIQYPIIGNEVIKLAPITDLRKRTEYDEENDIIFYHSPKIIRCGDIIIGNGFFTILFPNDAHEPQHFVDEAQIIKKITIKVRVK